MRRLSCILMAAILMLNFTACGAQETKLCAGYCTFYSDGGLEQYVEYTYEYDKNGNRTEECEYHNGSLFLTKEITYDGSGNYTETEYDQRGNLKCCREYDGNGVLRAQSDYGYDEELESYYEYNKDGLVIFKESYKWGHYSIVYEYDGSGNLVKGTETDETEDGSAVTYESVYDTYGNRIQRTVTYANGETLIDFHAEIEEDGNRQTIYQYRADGVITYIVDKEYDDDGNLLKEVTTMKPENEILISYEYEYDSEGRMTLCIQESMDRTETRYTYAEEGYLSSESITTYRWISNEVFGDGSDAVLSECITEKNYDPDGNLTRINYLVDGKIESYTEYYYENVTIKSGTGTSFDFREDDRELDPRANIVY